jgi:hypothetical protein
MEVIAAVLVGALLWLIGPGRRLWAVATTGSSGARKTRSALAAASERTRTPVRVSKPPALPARPAHRPTATAHQRDSLPPAVESQAVSLKLPPAVVAPLSIPPEAPGADAHAFQRTPITLGVALLLQAVGLGVMILVFATAYSTLERKVRADAQALERRMQRQIMALEASQTSTRQALEAMQASLAAQARAFEQLEAHLEAAPAKPIKTKSLAGK